MAEVVAADRTAAEGTADNFNLSILVGGPRRPPIFAMLKVCAPVTAQL
jgi:hypothetical protein